ncbi:MAG: NAD(P)-dependent oxidoreductase [Bryobacterales bacterium]|nr:NAD(P)-dependent oxidoreductase [Bryobacterales bacterium]
MANLGFLGLGIMGYPMARNLCKAGHHVAVWSHTAAKAEQLAQEAGAAACVSPREVAEKSDVIFLCVGDTGMSARVTLGAEGLIDGIRPGAVVADCSTVAPTYARRAATELKTKGAEFLDAPCTGSKPGAEGATLTFMIGGDPAVYEKVKPFFEVMGKRLYYCGVTGLGLHAKLSQNLILSNLLQAFNEGMVLAAKAGVNPELMLDILDNSAAKSGLVSYKAPFVFRRDFTTNFSVRWMHKDIGLMLETGEELGVPLPLTALTQQMFRTAMAQGLTDEDMCSTIKVLEKVVGVEVRSSKKL